MSHGNFQVEWQEDGSATVLGRITARDGSGAATGVDGEGKWLQIADVSTITCNVYDLSSATPTTAIVTPTVTVATSVLDTPITTAVIWTVDTTGYNFIFDLPTTAFPTQGHIYLVEFKVTTTGGTVFFGRYKGQAMEVIGS